MILSLGEDGRISLKQSEEDLSGITIAEWGAANMKLMNYLMLTGDHRWDKDGIKWNFTLHIPCKYLRWQMCMSGAAFCSLTSDTGCSRLHMDFLGET